MIRVDKTSWRFNAQVFAVVFLGTVWDLVTALTLPAKAQDNPQARDLVKDQMRARRDMLERDAERLKNQTEGRDQGDVDPPRTFPTMRTLLPQIYAADLCSHRGHCR